MELKLAHELASGLARAVKPFVHQGMIAGSIRRRKPEVKDLELLLIPRWETRPGPGDLFGPNEVSVNLLYEWATSAAPASGADGCPRLEWIKPSATEVEEWGVKPDGKYWRGYLPDHDVKVDIFLAQEDNWGGIALIRTGHAKFGAAVMGHAKRVGFQFDGGFLRRGDLQGEIVPMSGPDGERRLFETLNLEWVEPRDRTGPEALRTRRR